MEHAAANINKLVSLTFDENPQVRKHAAKSLGELDDPAAVFALVELSYDKDPTVREIAQFYLEKKRQTEPEIMSFATIFSSAKPEQKEESTDAKEKMLRPITQIFEKRLGKEKAEMAKSKMMPTIEKIYLKAHQHQFGSKKKQEESGRKVMQEFLTSYLEVMSDLDRIGSGAIQPNQTITPTTQIVPTETIKETEVIHELDVVGKPAEPDKISSEIAIMETQEIEEIKEREEIENLPDTFFKKAYETMMLSGGDEDIMKQEMNRMIDDARREIGLAFRMAKKRFKEQKITNITKIKDGMRNINTDILTVKGSANSEYQKTKKQKGTYTRVLVNDEIGNEGVVYLFDERGVTVKPGMRIKVIGGTAKTFVFSSETALTLGKKGNVYIVL